MLLTKLSKNKIFITSLVIFIFCVFLLPTLSFAQTSPYSNQVGPLIVNKPGLVTCDGSVEDPCNLTKFVDMINRIIEWIISIAGVIFTISLIYGGFLYLTAGENPGNKETAKKVITSTFYGFLIILFSWLIVYTILTILTGDKNGSSSIFIFLK
jgi:hypothetical protein